MSLNVMDLSRVEIDELNKKCEIIAYTTFEGEHEKVRLQTRQMCLRVTCNGISQREGAYRSLFDFARKKGCHISDVYEKYWMVNGKMSVDIVCSII